MPDTCGPVSLIRCPRRSTQTSRSDHGSTYTSVPSRATLGSDPFRKIVKAAPVVFSKNGGEPPKGLVSRLIDKIGPSNADSVPLPLLVLAGIAFLLLAAAAASFVARRIQARRVMPAPAPAEGPRDRS